MRPILLSLRSTLSISIRDPVLMTIIGVAILCLTIRDIIDGKARFVPPNYGDYKREEYPANFWVACILRLLVSLAILGFVIYHAFTGDLYPD